MRISDWSSDVCSSDLPTSFFIQWPARGIGSPRRLARLASAEALAPSSMELVVIGVDHMRPTSSRRLRAVIDYEIGRASCRELVWPYVYITVVAVSLKKTLSQSRYADMR